MIVLAPEEVRTVAALIVLAILLAVTLGALVLIVSSLRAVAADMQRLHMQQATIVRMLLRAGFRPAGTSRDWFDDPHSTKKADEDWFTQWDLRRPQ